MPPFDPPPGRPGRSLLDAIRGGAITVDGGMGTALLDLGIRFDVNYEALVLTRPELVQGIHEGYLRAGAQLLETNTFGGNRVRLARHGLDGEVRAVNVAAARLARAAAGERAHVAGAMGPTGLTLAGASDQARERVRSAFREQAEALAEGGVDALMIETMRQPEEIALALSGARQAVGDALPILALVSVGEGLTMADGTPVGVMGERLRALGCDVLGVNCCDSAEAVVAAVEKLLPLGVPLAALPSAGLPTRVGDRFVYPSTPAQLGVLARRLRALGVRLLGGCCGTTPEHVRRIAAAVRADRLVDQPLVAAR